MQPVHAALYVGSIHCCQIRRIVGGCNTLGRKQFMWPINTKTRRASWQLEVGRVDLQIDLATQGAVLSCQFQDRGPGSISLISSCQLHILSSQFTHPRLPRLRRLRSFLFSYSFDFHRLRSPYVLGRSRSGGDHTSWSHVQRREIQAHV